MGEWGGCAEYAIATAARLTPIPEGFDELEDRHLLPDRHLTPRGTWCTRSAGCAPATACCCTRPRARSRSWRCRSPKRPASASSAPAARRRSRSAKGWGYDHLIDSSGDWVAELKRLTGGRGVDLIVDGLAGPNSARNYDAAAPLGQVIYIGAIQGFPPPVDISRQLYAKTIAVRGYVVYTAMATTKGAELPGIHEALRSGRWKLPIRRWWASPTSRSCTHASSGASSTARR